MSDSTSAGIFGNIFVHLAKNPKPDEKFARWLMRQTREYDFHPGDMECDDALIKLGLAKNSFDTKYNEDTTLYYDMDFK